MDISSFVSFVLFVEKENFLKNRFSQNSRFLMGDARHIGDRRAEPETRSTHIHNSFNPLELQIYCAIRKKEIDF